MPRQSPCILHVEDDEIACTVEYPRHRPSGHPVLVFEGPDGSRATIFPGWEGLRRLKRAVDACLTAHPAIEAVPAVAADVVAIVHDLRGGTSSPVTMAQLLPMLDNSGPPIPAEAATDVPDDEDDTAEFPTADLAQAAEELPEGWRRNKHGELWGPSGALVLPSIVHPGKFCLSSHLTGGLTDGEFYPSERTAIEAAEALIAASQPDVSVQHVLYKTGDADAPDQILDKNGHVVLSCCRRCGKAEIELNKLCEGRREQPARASIRVDVPDLYEATAHDAELATGRANCPGRTP